MHYLSLLMSCTKNSKWLPAGHFVWINLKFDRYSIEVFRDSTKFHENRLKSFRVISEQTNKYTDGRWRLHNRLGRVNNNIQFMKTIPERWPTRRALCSNIRSGSTSLWLSRFAEVAARISTDWESDNNRCVDIAKTQGHLSSN